MEISKAAATGQELRPLLIDIDGWDYRGKPLDFNGIYQGLYRHSIFQTGETLIPGQLAVEMRLEHVGDVAWQKAFRKTYRQGLRADVRERSWSKAAARYLACWQLLQEELGHGFCHCNCYKWLCMCIGTRLISLYQQKLHNFPRTLAVMAWLRGYFSADGACWQLLLHRSQVLFQWSCVEEMAGNPAFAHRLQDRAMQLEDKVELAPPVDLRLFLCTGLARMVKVCGAPGEARWWMRKAWEYCKAQDGEPSAWEEVARSLQPMCLPPDHEDAPCLCGRSWCSAEREMAESKQIALISPRYDHLRWPLAPDEDMEEFYPSTGPPEFPPAEIVNSKLQELPNASWRSKFLSHYQNGHSMEEQERWSGAVPHYLACKHMIEKRCRGRPILATYKWLSCLIGTRLAFLYQSRLGQYENCIAILDWLLALVEPQHLSVALIIHRSAVLYQWSCQISDSGEDNGAARAEHLLQEAMEVKQVIGAALPPAPGMLCLLCVHLAYYSETDARKWLDKAFENIANSELHMQWQAMLQWHQVVLLDSLLGAWEEAKKAVLDFKEQQLETAPEEVKEEWCLEVLSRSLRCVLNVNERGQRGDRGVWWTGDATVSKTSAPHFGIRRLVKDVEAAAEHSQPWQPRSVTKHWNDNPHGWWTDYCRAQHGYEAYQALEQASDWREDQEKHLKKQILCAKTCLEIAQRYRRGMLPFWHSELGICYGQAGHMLEGLLEETLASASTDRPGNEEGSEEKTFLCNRGAAYEEQATSNYQASKDHLLLVVADDATLWHRCEYGARKYVSKHELKMEAFFASCGLLRMQGHRLLLEAGRRFLRQARNDNAVDNKGTEFQEYGCDRSDITTNLTWLEKEVRSFSAAFYEAEEYFESSMPPEPELSINEFIYLIERREESGCILHLWSKTLAWKKHVLSKILKAAEKLLPSRMLQEVDMQRSDCDKERVLVLERSLHSFFAFYWSHVYKEDVQPAWMDFYSNEKHSWCIMPEDGRFGTSVIYQFVDGHYHFLGGGLLTIFVIQTILDEENKPVSHIQTFSSTANTEEIERILNELGSYASQDDKVVHGLQESYNQMLERLYDILVTPISQVLAAMDVEEKLTFVGDNYLARIPFSLLLNKETKEYLFQRHNISICPSFLALRHCQERFSALEKQPLCKAAVAVANPEYRTGRGAPRPLPTSGEEVKIIQEVFHDAQMKVVTLEGRNANVSSFLEEVERPEKKAFIHMAVHAGTAPKNIELSGSGRIGVMKQGAVFLAPARKRRNGKWELISGTLTMDDIFARGRLWNACMVVLSACESSQGQVLESGSLLNLPQALMLVGVPCIVAAQWRVHDGVPTLRMMELFYGHLRRGLDASSALRSAMLRMLEEGCHHMSRWGGFSVWGLPTARIA